MTKSKKQLIVEGFQKMDCEMLSFLMHDSDTYQDIPQEFFLKKLSETFEEIKLSGDTFLDAHEGICTSHKCSNCGRSGFSFIGNVTKNHLDFIFEGTEECINDIFRCYRFITKDSSVKKNRHNEFTFNIDDQPGFRPGMDYLVKNEKCRSACEELMQHRQIIMDKTIYIQWVEKHASLFDSFESMINDYSNYDKFYSLYANINKFAEFLNYNKVVQEALVEYETIGKLDEIQLVKWLIKYEEVFDNYICFPRKKIKVENSVEDFYYEVSDLKINAVDFVHITKFITLFGNKYQKMLEKYRTDYTNLEMNNFETEDYADYSSLTFQLKKRGILN